MTHTLVAITLLTLSALVAARQQRDAGALVAAGTAQIAGTVTTRDVPPMPLRRALVTLTGEAGSDPVVAVTDDAGTFAFINLPAGRYSLSASKGAYVPISYGTRRPGGSGTPIVVSDGQRVSVAMALPKGSVITGVVRDERGRPLPEVTVSALRYVVSYWTGERTLESASIGSAGLVNASYAVDAFPGTAVTDDRGAYRIYGLAAGEYLISAAVRPPRASILQSTDVHQVSSADVRRAQRLLQESRGAPVMGVTSMAPDPAASSRVEYASVYHPAAMAAAEAETIALGPSEERSGIDVLLRLVPTAAIAGVVTSVDGSPVENAQVSVMAPGSDSGRVMRATRSNFDGEFVIPGISPGRYQMQASSYADGLFGMTEVLVEGRDLSTSFVLSPGITVSGRVVFDGAAPAPAFDTMSPILRRHTFTTGGPRFQRGADGAFVFSHVPPGRYRFMVSGRQPAGWILRSAILNGVDVSDVAFDVNAHENIEGVVMTLTDRPAEISGTLQTAAGGPAPEYVLVVFSADARFRVPRSRRTQHVRPDVTGRFIVRNLPAGDYLISAVTDVEDGQWNDPAFLAELAASAPIRVSLAEGDRKVQDIRIGGR